MEEAYAGSQVDRPNLMTWKPGMKIPEKNEESSHLSVGSPFGLFRFVEYG